MGLRCEGQNEGQGKASRDDGVPCWLTPDCARVQGDILELVEALSVAALSEFDGLVPSFRKAVDEFRGHLRRHVSEVEGPGGVCECLVAGDPALGGHVNRLCHEHAELDQRLEGLERRLAEFDGADPQWEPALRQYAARLADVLRAHNERGRMLASSASPGAPREGRR